MLKPAVADPLEEVEVPVFQEFHIHHDILVRCPES
jgi:hypothetical protein